MPHKLFGFLAALVFAFAFPARAQIVGSPYEPQIAELTIEGRVPLTSLFAASPTAISFPPEILAQLQSGQLELRGRIEFNRAARILRIFQFIVPSGTPLPLPQAPPVDAPNVGVSTDLHLESIRWHQFPLGQSTRLRQVVLIVGRTLATFSRTGPGVGESGTISFGFDDNDPTKLNFLTISYPGEITAVVQQVWSNFRFEPRNLKAPE
jgi:hypothetical protein